MSNIGKCDICGEGFCGSTSHLQKDSNAKSTTDESDLTFTWGKQTCVQCNVSVHIICYEYGGVYHPNMSKILQNRRHTSSSPWRCALCTQNPKPSTNSIDNKQPQCVFCNFPELCNKNEDRGNSSNAITAHAMHPLIISKSKKDTTKEATDSQEKLWIHTVCGLALEHHPRTRGITYGVNSYGDSLNEIQREFNTYNSSSKSTALSLVPRQRKLKLSHFVILSEALDVSSSNATKNEGRETKQFIDLWPQTFQMLRLPSMGCLFCESGEGHTIQNNGKMTSANDNADSGTSSTSKTEFQMCLPCNSDWIMPDSLKKYPSTSTNTHSALQWGIHVGCSMWRRSREDFKLRTTLEIPAVRIEIVGRSQPNQGAMDSDDHSQMFQFPNVQLLPWSKALLSETKPSPLNISKPSELSSTEANSSTAAPGTPRSRSAAIVQDLPHDKFSAEQLKKLQKIVGSHAPPPAVVPNKQTTEVSNKPTTQQAEEPSKKIKAEEADDPIHATKKQSEGQNIATEIIILSSTSSTSSSSSDESNAEGKKNVAEKKKPSKKKAEAETHEKEKQKPQGEESIETKAIEKEASSDKTDDSEMTGDVQQKKKAIDSNETNGADKEVSSNEKIDDEDEEDARPKAKTMDSDNRTSSKSNLQTMGSSNTKEDESSDITRFPSHIKCDICNKRDGHMEHNLQECSMCGLTIHDNCYGMEMVDYKRLNWKCMACLSTTEQWPEKYREKKRPTECVLCPISHGFHAMHPMYDKEGKDGKPLLLPKTKVKPRRYGWVHTLCAMYVTNDKITTGSVFACDKNGKADYHQSNDDSSDEESSNSDDEEENIDYHHFVFEQGEVWENAFKTYRELKCFLCGKTDSKSKTLGIPVQCQAGDEMEDETFKKYHRKEEPCFQAMHVGCARWYDKNDSLVQTRRLLYYPGDNETPDPEMACFCTRHAQQIVDGQYPKKSASRKNTNAPRGMLREGSERSVDASPTYTRKRVASRPTSTAKTGSIERPLKRSRLQKRQQHTNMARLRKTAPYMGGAAIGRQRRPPEFSNKNLSLSTLMGGAARAESNAAASAAVGAVALKKSRDLASSSLRETLLKRTSSTGARLTAQSVNRRPSSSNSNMRRAGGSSSQRHLNNNGRAIGRPRSGPPALGRSQSVVSDRERDNYIKHRKLCPEGRERDYVDMRFEYEIETNYQLSKLPSVTDETVWVGCSDVETALVECLDHDAGSGSIALGMEGDFLAICGTHCITLPLKSLALAILEQTCNDFKSKGSESPSKKVLLSFMQMGGMLLLRAWLQEAEESLRTSHEGEQLVKPIIKVLSKIPINANVLCLAKECKIGLILKYLSTTLSSEADDDMRFQELAKMLQKIIQQWKKVGTKVDEGKKEEEDDKDIETPLDLAQKDLKEVYHKICEYEEKDQQAPWLKKPQKQSGQIAAGAQQKALLNKYEKQKLLQKRKREEEDKKRKAIEQAKKLEQEKKIQEFRAKMNEARPGKFK